MIYVAHHWCVKIETVQIKMENDIAEYAGSNLLGGSGNNCYLVQKVFVQEVFAINSYTAHSSLV